MKCSSSHVLDPWINRTYISGGLSHTRHSTHGINRSRNTLTGEQFLLSLLAKAKLSTADVNAKWKASGRKNVANILLGQLVKKGQLKRADNKGGRGSIYSAT